MGQSLLRKHATTRMRLEKPWDKFIAAERERKAQAKRKLDEYYRKLYLSDTSSESSEEEPEEAEPAPKKRNIIRIKLRKEPVLVPVHPGIITPGFVSVLNPCTGFTPTVNIAILDIEPITSEPDVEFGDEEFVGFCDEDMTVEEFIVRRGIQRPPKRHGLFKPPPQRVLPRGLPGRVTYRPAIDTRTGSGFPANKRGEVVSIGSDGRIYAVGKLEKARELKPKYRNDTFGGWVNFGVRYSSKGTKAGVAIHLCHIG